MSSDSQPNAAVDFAAVLAAEATHVRNPSFASSVRDEAVPKKLVDGPAGLAFSGGGIRSATFCLGVLQALALQGKLKSFDYLSTVSGGGYIGSWLTAWIYRDGFDAVDAALRQSPATGAVEPPQVQWLRRYSNYLTPRVGMLSTDALTVVATWLRNVLLNLLILIGLFASLQFAAVALLPLADKLIYNRDFNGALSMSLAAFALGVIALNLSTHYRLAGAINQLKLIETLAPKWVLLLVVVPICIASLTGAIWLISLPFDPEDFLRYFTYLFWWLTAVLAVMTLFAQWSNERLRAQLPNALPTNAKANAMHAVKDLVVFLFSGMLALAAGYALCKLLANVWPYDNFKLYEDQATATAVLLAPIVTVGPAAMMIIFGICISIWIGLIGRSYREDSREWWARLGGWVMFFGLSWLVVTLLFFYVPPWVAALASMVPVWAAALGGTWAASIPVVFKVLGTISHSRQNDTQVKNILINIAIGVFAAGFFILIAAAAGAVMMYLTTTPYPEVKTGAELPAIADFVFNYHLAMDKTRELAFFAQHPDGPSMTFAALACALAAIVLAFRVDINRFSLHNMYKNRLIRCYLGASNRARFAQPFTGFDREDDLSLKDLDRCADGKVQRPLHLINTALNLVQGADLAWQERKAASFLLSSKYCGFQFGKTQGNDNPVVAVGSRAGFRPTDGYATRDESGDDRGFSLGMAMATSGAAASPNQGYHSQPSLAVLMTFLNIRLGRWSPNPVGDAWNKSSPQFGLAYLLAELTGYSNESRDFVYLSDGGHFENMGVYELVRRRCRVIVAVDCGADPGRAFDDLGNMIRKCRIDFGVEIELDMTKLFGAPPSNLSEECCQIGDIFYDKSRNEAGVFIYIKPSMLAMRKEAVDLLNYKTGDNAFPQQTTADQWFDESQFESYRKLGFEIGTASLKAHGNLI